MTNWYTIFDERVGTYGKTRCCEWPFTVIRCCVRLSGLRGVIDTNVAVAGC